MGFDELFGRRVTAADFNDIGEEPMSVNGQPGHSWVPSSLIDEARNPPSPPEIGGLLYQGKRTLLSGETESLKTWLALILCKAEMDAGFTVGWVDLDAMGPADLLERLRALGVEDEVTHKRFLYFSPHGRLDGEALGDFTARLKMHGVRLCVIDAFNPILTMHGYEPNSVVDVERFWTEIADPISRAGACPAVIDHVVKDPDRRGKYSTGSERKASGCIVHIGFRLVQMLKRGGVGRSILVVHKDRPGFLPRPLLGRLVLVSDGVGVSYDLEPPQVEGQFRPTALMEKVSVYMELHMEAASKRGIEENVTGKAEGVRAAVEALAQEGFLSREQGGKGGGELFTSTKPYRQDDDLPSASLVRPAGGFLTSTNGSKHAWLSQEGNSFSASPSAS